MDHAASPRWNSILINLIAWAAAIWIAYELLYYEQYKLTGQTLIFDRLSDWSGIPEKPFRLFVACMEIIAAILVLIPRTQGFGGLFAAGIMGEYVGRIYEQVKNRPLYFIQEQTPVAERKSQLPALPAGDARDEPRS